jgi:uncharacterized protein (TIGR00269 family)
MDIEKQVSETIKKYKLCTKKEKIVVALSGGKDSTSLLYIMNKLGYNVHGLMIDLYLGEWSKTHNGNMIAFCKQNDIPLTIVDLKKELGQGICFIKAIVKKHRGLTGCSVCGTVKRWILNRYAKKLKADKLATGHNLDDEAQNVLMNFLKGNILLGINSSPATGGKKVDGFVQRIKPLFFTPEDEIMKYAKKKNFQILYDKCPCAFGTYRVETRTWTKDLSNKEKLKVVEGFQKILLKLRTENKRELKKCKKCGDPARKDLCNFCEVMDCV